MSSPITILMADDDEEDYLLAREALAENSANCLKSVQDGEELLDYLYRRGKYVEASDSPRPDLIILDLNMPKKDGHQVLKQIKSDVTLRPIPVVVLTTSKAQADIYQSYELGANSFITKPMTFSSLVEVMKVIEKYWFEIVELPPNRIEDG